MGSRIQGTQCIIRVSFNLLPLSLVLYINDIFVESFFDRPSSVASITAQKTKRVTVVYSQCLHRCVISQYPVLLPSTGTVRFQRKSHYT